MYSVTVLTPRGRRQQVKVTPNTTLLQVLEEVCTKHGFNAMEYDLRHHNKVLDVSSMFRFTSLPNNAQLEMTEAVKQRQESEVTLGLQLESGERLTGVFFPSDSIWHVVITLHPEEEKLTNLVVIYMRQEIYGKENLCNTTLRSLGLTGGRAMLRLLHKSPEELHIQANVSSNLTRVAQPEDKVRKEPEPKAKSNFEKEESKKSNTRKEEMKKTPSPERGPSSSSRSTTTENYNFKGNVFEKLMKEEKSRRKLPEKQPPKPTPELPQRDIKSIELNKLEKESDDASRRNQKSGGRSNKDWEHKQKEDILDSSKVILLGERNAVAYNLNCVKPVEFDEEPDDFFDLTVNDAKTLLRQAKQLCAELEDAPLMTAAQRELEKDKKVLTLLHQYKKTVLRIKFPDRTVLQGTFSPVETISEVEKFVAGYLENPKLKFHLYTTPPKTVLKTSERLIECGCVPSSVLYFGLVQAEGALPSQYLRSDVLTRLSTPSAAALTALQSRGNERKLPENRWEDPEKRKWKRDVKDNEAGPSGSKQWEKRSGREESTSPQIKLPKWFKSNK
ncbi:hypothetical protein RUM44_003104 [Polyplax serrata]|uniref:UBX domain-containing protein n=1 Tax=Polyplax serrata TaxID=468196 RepID=A0ABR1AXN2_POLSC